jgi:hypothetical protein
VLVNQQEFEAGVLQLWMTTRVPMTRANLLFYTKAPRKRVGAWLDEMVADGVLEVDADNDGEMIWAVRGAKRPENGPERLDEGEAGSAGGGDFAARLERLKRDALGEAARTGGGMVLARKAGDLLRPAKEGDKSLIASGLLSFFFGPLGWLYAAPLKTAIPAIVLFVIAYSILPGFLLTPLLAIGAPIFALAGVAYAWRHNQAGHRAPLLRPEPDDEPRPRGALPRKR